MARRNVWTAEETKELLTVIKDRNLMKYFGEERNSKLYKIAQNELEKRGFNDKDAFQIEHKWKNLKRSYYKTKRENYLIESCEFYEELDELMAMKPISLTAKTKDSAVKRPKPVLESFDILLTKLTKAERENNDELTKKEKDLIDYQFDLYTQDERHCTSNLSELLAQNMEDFCGKAQQILAEDRLCVTVMEAEVVDMAIEGEEIDSDSKKEVVKEFYQAWKEEETL